MFIELATCLVLHFSLQDDYAKKKAFKCSYCKKPIVPKDGQNTAPRLRAMGRDFHPDGLKCEVNNKRAKYYFLVFATCDRGSVI